MKDIDNFNERRFVSQTEDHIHNKKKIIIIIIPSESLNKHELLYKNKIYMYIDVCIILQSLYVLYVDM